MLSKVVQSCHGCRKKKEENDNINNNKQQRTTKQRQSTPAVIAEASQSTRYGTGSVAETAIRDLLTQTQRGILAELAKKLSDVVLVVVKKKKTTTKTT
ncbi:MAG: hypothetical protein IKJ56_02510 [Bacteroidales bacterium]|nr:hypothetical protein [Bacteroidales bacterium]